MIPPAEKEAAYYAQPPVLAEAELNEVSVDETQCGSPDHLRRAGLFSGSPRLQAAAPSRFLCVQYEA
jgi:hypothetical protein